MTCQAIEERIRAYLAGDLSAAEKEAVEDHLDGCAACRAQADREFALEPLDAPAGLLEAVLERTSGTACGQAEVLICASTDGELAGLDVELLRSHLDGCRDCHALEIVLSRLGRDLPALCGLKAAPGFVAGVLAATTGTPARRRAERIRWAWHRLFQRPRFAWEAAYVGAMLFWLVLGAPLAIPSDVLERGTEPLSAVRSAAASPPSILESIRGGVAGIGTRFWGSTRDVWSRSFIRIQSDLDARGQRAGNAVEDIRRHGSDLREAVRSLDLVQGGRAMRDLTGDAGEVVNRFVTNDNRAQE